MSSQFRVVVFSHDSALGRFGWEAVRVASAYEAAAELLDGGARVLVIDLRALTDRHVGLLAVAREMDVEMLAVGSLPSHLSSEELSGVRLIAHDHLDRAVRRCLAEAAGPPPAAAEVGVDPDLLARVLAAGDETVAEAGPQPGTRPLRPAPAAAGQRDVRDDTDANPLAGRKPIFPRHANGPGAERATVTESLGVVDDRGSGDIGRADAAEIEAVAGGATAGPPTLGMDALLTAEELAGLLGDEPC